MVIDSGCCATVAEISSDILRTGKQCIRSMYNAASRTAADKRKRRKTGEAPRNESLRTDLRTWYISHVYGTVLLLH